MEICFALFLNVFFLFWKFHVNINVCAVVHLVPVAQPLTIKNKTIEFRIGFRKINDFGVGKEAGFALQRWFYCS